MEAGREIDALIAEKVMGYIERWTPNGTKRLFPPYEEMGLPRVTDWRGSRDPNWDRSVLAYSTDIAAAWQVVEQMQARGCLVHIRGPYIQSGWSASVSFGDLVYESPSCNVTLRADTAPLAICLASLKACGVAIE